MDVDLQEAGSSRARRASASSSAKYNPAKRRNSRSSTAYDDEDEDVPPGYTVSRTLDGDDHADSHAALLGTTEDDDDDTGKFSEDGHRPRPALSQHPSQIATVEQRKALWWKNVFITGIFVLLWYGFATLLSLYNKWMFSPQYYDFPYPLFVTACHMVVQFCLAGLIRVSVPRFRPLERPTRQDYASKVLPTAVSTGGDIGLSNLSIKTITLSLYTMCKSSTVIFVLVFAFLFHLETYSLRLVFVISLISFGVFLMVFNTTAVSIPGIIMVFSASALAGLRWGLTELVMHKKAMGLSNPFATIFWLAPLMAVTLGLVSLAIEGWVEIFGSEFFVGWRAVQTGGVVVLPGAVAFAMVSSEYFIIQRAGVVPLSIAGIFKEVTTISISAWVFGDQLTELNIIGVAITICGIALYTYHKYQKSISSPIPLDPHGHPIPAESGESGISTPPMISAPPRTYADTERQPLAGVSEIVSQGLPMASLEHRIYPPPPKSPVTETNAERTDRIRDEFEGWGPDDDSWSEEDGEVDEDEVERRRNERTGEEAVVAKSWGNWWDKEM